MTNCDFKVYPENAYIDLNLFQLGHERYNSTHLFGPAVRNHYLFHYVMSGKDVILQRSVPYGKNAVINSMMEIKKLSEKEAKTLLSNRKMIEEQVTEEEYAEAVRYLVSSIGRIVEYHRSRNPERVIDGIKVFGEGSAIEGIDEVLQQELGAEVSHFDQLNGVRVSGKAYLTAETALHYLANFGAVLNPIGLIITQGRTKEQKSGLVNKLLIAVLIVAVLVMGTLSALKLVKYFGLKSTEQFIEADIASMEDIEGIAQNYENSVAAYKVVKEFADGTSSDNEMLLQFINDMEKALPADAHIDKLQSVDGTVAFEVTGTSAELGKEEIADFIVKLKGLDYVSGVMLTKASDTLAPYRPDVEVLSAEDFIEANTQNTQNGQNEEFEIPYEVVFPLEVQLKNAQGTAISDEVAVALAGSTAATTDENGNAVETATVEEEVELP